MAATATLAGLLGQVVGNARSRAGDMAELIPHIHAIQQAILSQAAARVYPGEYRLLGEVLDSTEPPPYCPDFDLIINIERGLSSPLPPPPPPPARDPDYWRYSPKHRRRYR
jgi:hypothetical protein